MIYDDILQRRAKPYLDNEKEMSIEEHHYDNIPSDEERAARVIQSSNPNNLNLLRAISYQQAQQNIFPLLNIPRSDSDSIQSSLNHSIEQQRRKYNVESIEEEDEQSQPIRPTTFSANSDFVKTIKNFKIEKTHRQKQARFRWFLAYSLLNNCRLCHQRKYVQSRLAVLRMNQIN